MAKPAVFVFTTAYHPFIGGAEIAVAEIARRLGSQFDFFIITARMRPDLARREARKEGTVIRLGFGSRADKFFLPVLGAVAVLRLSRRRSPALFWCVMVSYAAGAAYLVNFIRWRRVPILQTIQEGDSEAHIRQGRGGLIGLSWRLLLARADAVQTISAYLGALARRYGYRGPAEVIPNGADLERFGRRPSEIEIAKLRSRLELGDGPVVITASRLAPKNGLDTLIRAVAGLRDRFGRSATLVICGEGEERARLEELSYSLGLASSVRFLGNVLHGQLHRYFALAEVFCRPSRSEGLGSAFLEAMASGLPVLATPVGGIPDFLRDGENGFFIRVDDPDDLAEKLHRLLSDVKLRSRLSDGARATAARYGWDASAAMFAELFNRLIAAALHPRLLIATPNFPPDLGGPATYAARLGEELWRLGYPVEILTYGAPSDRYDAGRVHAIPLSIPPGLRHARYLWAAVLLAARRCAVILLDGAGVGLPALLAARLWGRACVLRIEGDPLWERYVERTGEEITLSEFYRSLPARVLTRRERALRSVLGWVAKRVKTVVFSSPWRQHVFQRGYRISRGRARQIPTPWFPGTVGKAREREPVILWAGRMIRVKNLVRLARAFVKVAPAGWRLELYGAGPEQPRLAAVAGGHGDRILVQPPLTREALARRLSEIAAVALPSLAEVSPRLALECVAARTPFLLTRESGFADIAERVGLVVDPLDARDLEAKLRALMDPATRAELARRMAAFGKGPSWTEVARMWVKLCGFGA